MKFGAVVNVRLILIFVAVVRILFSINVHLRSYPHLPVFSQLLFYLFNKTFSSCRVRHYIKY